MAYGRGGYGRSKKKGTSLRLTGLFKAKKRGLFVGSASELGELIDVVKKAKADEAGLVFFLWRNQLDEDSDKKQPDFTLYVDVNQEEDRPRKRRKIEDDDEDEPRPKKKGKKPVEDDDDDEPEEKDEDDDEVPF